MRDKCSPSPFTAPTPLGGMQILLRTRPNSQLYLTIQTQLCAFVHGEIQSEDVFNECGVRASVSAFRDAQEMEYVCGVCDARCLQKFCPLLYWVCESERVASLGARNWSVSMLCLIFIWKMASYRQREGLKPGKCFVYVCAVLGRSFWVFYSQRGNASALYLAKCVGWCGSVHASCDLQITINAWM